MDQAILNSQSTLFLYEKNPLRDQHCNLQSRELVHSAVQCIRSVGESITGTSNTLTNQVLIYNSTITCTDTLHYVPVLVVVPVQIHSGQVSIKGWLVRPSIVLVHTITSSGR